MKGLDIANGSPFSVPNCSFHEGMLGGLVCVCRHTSGGTVGSEGNHTHILGHQDDIKC